MRGVISRNSDNAIDPSIITRLSEIFLGDLRNAERDSDSADDKKKIIFLRLEKHIGEKIDLLKALVENCLFESNPNDLIKHPNNSNVISVQSILFVLIMFIK